MELVIPEPHEAHAGLRAIKTVLTCEAPLNPIETKLLEAAQTHILRHQVDLEALSPIAPAELAQAVTRPEVRAQLVRGMVIGSFASGDANETQLELIGTFAAALGVEPPALEELRRLVHKQLATLRFDVLRKMYIGQAIGSIWDDEGFRGIMKVIGSFRGWREEPELAARYQAMGELPLGTLGREFYEHCRRHEFPLPGERFCGPELMVRHDMAHVLGGYGSDPEGEMQVAAFTAGFRREQSMHILLFVLCQFDLGIQMVPVAAPEFGNLDADLFLRALARGARMNLDLFDWDYWAVIEQPVTALRERYGITAA
ncbi:MAG: hypothetical protein AAF799_19870 [Myxococcota bacterium]